MLDEQVELLSLIGDVASKDDGPSTLTLWLEGETAPRTGHLQRAYVRPTCEVVLTVSPVHLQKSLDPASGLFLITL